MRNLVIRGRIKTKEKKTNPVIFKTNIIKTDGLLWAVFSQQFNCEANI